MTNVGEVTKKKPGKGLVNLGLYMAGLGLLLVIAVFSSGGTPTLIVWGVLTLGAVLSVIGFARRILAAVESR